MDNNTLNYTEQGGAKTVIGGEIEVSGTLTIADGASVTGITTATIVDALTSTDATKALSAKQGKVLKDALDAKTAANQADSTASELAGLVSDFNGLLAKLKTAGLMVDDT